jgi:Domain of unknown function (DUF3482).
MLKLYGFRTSDAAASDLPLLDGRWGDDLFNPETLKHLGVRVGSGIAAGAAAGAGVDLMVGGLTLGAAALPGPLPAVRCKPRAATAAACWASSRASAS